MQHLIFFDDGCSLCRKSIRLILDIDHDEIFSFAPLDGNTAARELPRVLKGWQKEDSLVLLENYGTLKQKLWLRGRAVFRIFWLLGDFWTLLGWLCFVPIGVDFLYRIIARHRALLPFDKEDFSHDENHRFLP